MESYGHVTYGRAWGQAALLAVCAGVWIACSYAWADVAGEASEEVSFLDTARFALDDGLPAVAERQVRRFLDEPPPGKRSSDTDAAAEVLLLRALYEQRKPEAMLAFLDELARTGAPKERPARRLFWRAVAILELGRNEEALALADTLRRDYPENEFSTRVGRVRAWSLLRLGRKNEALAAFRDYAEGGADLPGYYLNTLDWGKALLAANSPGEAVTVLSQAAGLESDPALQRRGRLWLARAQAELREWPTALEGFKALGEDEACPRRLRAEAWFGAGKVEEMRGQVADAVAAYRRGLVLAVDDAQRREGGFALGRLFLAERRFDEAAPLLKEFIAANPELERSRQAQLSLADGLLAAGLAERAVEEYQRFLESFNDPGGQVAALDGHARGLVALGRHGEAAKTYGRLAGLATNPVKRAESVFRMGDALLADGQYRQAEAAFRRVQEDFGATRFAPVAGLQLAESLAAGGQTEAAETLLRALATEHGDTHIGEQALYRIGILMGQKEAWDEAVKAWDELIQVYSNGMFQAEAFLGRGLASFHLFRFGSARADFERVTARHPGTAIAEQAEFHRALCYYWMGRDDDAIAVCKTFLEKHPDSSLLPDVGFWIGEAQYNRGRFAEAEKAFLSFVERHPEHAWSDDALLWAGRSAARLKEYVRSVEILTRLVRTYPDSDRMVDVRFTQADALSELANYAAAILVFDEIINNYPDSDLVNLAWGRKGDCQFMLGAGNPERYRESIASYRVVAASSTAGTDLVLQAEYKVGRCLEKLQRMEEALEQYYAKVLVRYMRDREKGVWHNEGAKLWFARAAFNAADIMETRQDWRGVIRVLDRVVQAGVPAAAEARERIERIRAERWWMVY